jgi:BMFP domain-containing protein YqiC
MTNEEKRMIVRAAERIDELGKRVEALEKAQSQFARKRGPKATIGEDDAD